MQKCLYKYDPMPADVPLPFSKEQLTIFGNKLKEIFSSAYVVHVMNWVLSHRATKYSDLLEGNHTWLGKLILDEWWLCEVCHHQYKGINSKLSHRTKCIGDWENDETLRLDPWVVDNGYPANDDRHKKMWICLYCNLFTEFLPAS
jgi:hypothetical protein